MSEIVIAGAARTPIGSFNGAFASVPAHYLGEVAIRSALERSGVEPAEVSEVVMGQILTAGQSRRNDRLITWFDARRKPLTIASRVSCRSRDMVASNRASSASESRASR